MTSRGGDLTKEMTFDEFAAAYCETQKQTPEGLRRVLVGQAKMFKPDGWLLLQCQMLDSSQLGNRTILPFGPENTHKEVPGRPISPRGLASDMSVVIGVLKTVNVESP